MSDHDYEVGFMEVTDLRARLATVEAERDAAQTALRASPNDAVWLTQQQIAVVQTEVARLTEEAVRMGTEIGVIRTDRDRLSAELTEVRRECDALECNALRWEADCDRLAAELAEARIVQVFAARDAAESHLHGIPIVGYEEMREALVELVALGQEILPLFREYASSRYGKEARRRSEDTGEIFEAALRAAEKMGT